MSALHVYWLLCGVLAVGGLMSPVLRPRGRHRPLLVAVVAVMLASVMPELLSGGPGWAAAGWAALGWWLLRVVVPLVVPILLDAAVPLVARRLTPEELRERLAASLPGADRILLGVWPNKMIGLTVDTPTRRRLQRPVLLRSGCQICFVESVLRDVLDHPTEVIGTYRNDLAGGVNRVLVLDREYGTGPWRASVEPVSGTQVAPRADCPTHGRSPV